MRYDETAENSEHELQRLERENRGLRLEADDANVN